MQVNNQINQPSFRSQFVFKRTYNRPLNQEGTQFETFEQTLDRVIAHQRWLWESAKGKNVGDSSAPLTKKEEEELERLAKEEQERIERLAKEEQERLEKLRGKVTKLKRKVKNF